LKGTISDKGAYFPQSYLTDMFRFVARNSDKIQVVTYQDFDWRGDFDYAHGYPEEKKGWLKGIKNGQKNSDKAYLLIQYDLDSRPDRSMSLLSHPDHAAVPANIMLFAKRVDRRLLKTTGKLEHTDYEIDDELLSSLAEKGFVVGHHSNCYERSHHNVNEASQILDADINDLKQRFDINFYTAHGGVPCKDGRNNRDMMPLPETSSKVRWVHNGATPFFNKQFSDGGHNSPKLDPADRDIRDFISRMVPGGRYRILVHPQYYDTKFALSKRYSGTPWYDEMLDSIATRPDFDSWEDVVLTNFVNRNSVSKAKIEAVQLVDTKTSSVKGFLSRLRRQFIARK